MFISKEKKEKISEQILAYLYFICPKSSFTSYIAREIARDEEFTKKLILELREKKLVLEINKNSKGKKYLIRSRWKISDAAYEAYKTHQKTY